MKIENNIYSSSFILLLIILLLGFPLTHAVIPSHVRICDPSINCANQLKIALISQISTNYLFFSPNADGGFFDSALISGKTTFSFINFTNIALGAPTNPAQSFSLSTQNSNATLSKITSSAIQINESFISGNPKLFYYYNNNALTTYPSSLNVTYLDTAWIIPSNQYYTSIPLFNSCIAPCAYVNTGNNTLIVKGQTTSPLTINLCTIGICPTVVVKAGASVSNSDYSSYILTLSFIMIASFAFLFLMGHSSRRRRENQT